MLYSVEITPSAKREIGKFERTVQASILDEIEILRENPRPAGAKKLSGVFKGLYRIRAGPKHAYRVIYNIRDNLLTVVVVKVADRKQAYR